MERAMTVEEKIRRAEEIYEKRRQGETRPVTKVTVNDKKDVKLLKKMVIQILICVSIYLIVYTIQNRQYVFSEDFINKVNEILSYDTNFIEIYENIINFMKQDTETNTEKNTEVNTETNLEMPSEEELNNQAMGGAEEVQEQQGSENMEDSNNSNDSTENLSQADLEIQNIKNTTTFIKPVEGVISSKYGQRETATRSGS